MYPTHPRATLLSIASRPSTTDLATRAARLLAARVVLLGCSARPGPVKSGEGRSPPHVAPPLLKSSSRVPGYALLAATSGAGPTQRWTRAGAWVRGSARGVAARFQVTRPVVVGEEDSLVEVEAQL